MEEVGRGWKVELELGVQEYEINIIKIQCVKKFLKINHILLLLLGKKREQYK